MLKLEIEVHPRLLHHHLHHHVHQALHQTVADPEDQLLQVLQEAGQGTEVIRYTLTRKWPCNSRTSECMDTSTIEFFISILP